MSIISFANRNYTKEVISMSLKKMLALGCALVLTVAALAACGGTAEEATEATDATEETEMAEPSIIYDDTVEYATEEETVEEEAATLEVETDAE